MRHVLLGFCLLCGETFAIVHAATITVGPDGTFSTIQQGVSAALLLGGDNDVRVESGSYGENLVLDMSSGNLTLSGGWNSAFATQASDPADTTISGGVSGRTLDATLSGGSLLIRYFLVIGGSAPDHGGGMNFLLSKSASAQVVKTNFAFNTVTASSTNNALGGAIYAELHDSSFFDIDSDQINDNSVTVANGFANGGGVYIKQFDGSQVFVFNNSMQGNVAVASGAAGNCSAGAIEIALKNSAHNSFIGNRIVQNSLQASGGSAAGFAGATFSAACDGGCQFDISQNVFDQNVGTIAAQLNIGMASSAGTPSMNVNDLLVSRGNGNGMQVLLGEGVAHLTNLTIADNAGTGLSFLADSTITLYNTIASGNGTDILVVGNGAQEGNNLIGVDPHFIDAPHGNYRLQSDSLARDAGDDSPPGGLPAQDLDGYARVFGGHVDIGAYEIGDEIFANGFE
jgi:hypothetical protein